MCPELPQVPIPPRPDTRLKFDPAKEPSLTKQSFKDECDINVILKRYKLTGLVEHVQSARGGYGDFTQVTDYQSALNAVLLAQDAFLELPATIRERFGNEPDAFVRFVDDPANAQALVDLGLAVAKDAPASPAQPGGSQTPVAPATP